jgi:ElaB/YqjD/DUF883 family membrane-anchored ribosome-binding protein
MNSESELSSRAYEREARSTRNRLAASLDELNHRLTPGQVFDEVLTYARGGGGTFFRALTNAARENPIPTLLVGAGCMLFVSDKLGLTRYVASRDGSEGSSARDTLASRTRRAMNAGPSAADQAASGVGSMSEPARSRLRDTSGYLSEQAASAAEGVRRGAGAVSETLTSASQSAAEAARNTSSRVADTARGVRDQVSERTEHLARVAQGAADTACEYSGAVTGQVAETASRARRQVSETTRRVTASTSSLIHDQPLLCAAVGLAVGAAIAAVLPATRTEDELMGERSDAAKEKLGQVASEQLQAAKAAATAAAQTAGSAALREGLSPSGAGDVARGLSERVKRVVTEAASAGASEIRNRTGLNTQS